MPVPSACGVLYIAVLLNDATEFSDVYFIYRKSEIFSELKKYKVIVENKTNKTMYAIRMDRAGENKKKRHKNNFTGKWHGPRVFYCLRK